MGEKLLLAAAVLAGLSLSLDCLAPTQVTLDITTDVDCSRRPNVGITSASQGTSWSAQPNATETQTCDHGEIGTLVLVPGDAKTFSVRVVGGVGFSATECATGKADPGSGHGDPHKPDPKHLDWGCIQATRGLGFVAHKPLRLPIRLYAKCIGKLCDQGQTCGEDGACISDVISDCGPDGVCKEPTGGSGGMTGSGGAPSSSTSSSSSSAGAGGAGGCGPMISDPENCGACGHDCLGGTCMASQCQPFILGSFQPGVQVLGGVAVDPQNVYWTMSNLVSTQPEDGLYAAAKDLKSPAVLFRSLSFATDVAVSNKEALIAVGAPLCGIMRCPLTQEICFGNNTSCPLVVGGDPAADALASANPSGVTFRYQGSDLPTIPQIGVTDVGVLGHTFAFSYGSSVRFVDAQGVTAPLAFTGAGSARGVALLPDATVAAVGSAILVSTDHTTVTALVPAGEEGAHQIAAIPWKGGALAAWAIDASISGATPAIRYVVFDPKAHVAASASTLWKALKPSDVALDAKAAYWADNGDGKVYGLALP